MTEWSEFLAALQKYPLGTHAINAPCSEEAIAAAEARLGGMPLELREMLAYFNGGELFIDAIPLVTLFGAPSPECPLPTALDIIVRTLSWRQHARGPNAEWVIGSSNYGGLLILPAGGHAIREWDSAQSRWSGQSWSPSEWMDAVLAEGPQYLEA